MREIILVCFEGAGRTDGVCECVYRNAHTHTHIVCTGSAHAAAELNLPTTSQSLQLDKRKVTGSERGSTKSEES